VLQALAADPARWRYGYELSKDIGLKAGTLYPILIRLYDQGLVETDWELDIPGGTPPRHLYRLTSDGLTAAAAVAAPKD
jgi:DNA-binding PadR family transcriptional regulator